MGCKVLNCCYKIHSVNAYREIIAVCSHIHTKHINTVCGQNVRSLMSNLVVHLLSMKFYFSLWVPQLIFIIYFQIVNFLSKSLVCCFFHGQSKAFPLALPLFLSAHSGVPRNFFGDSTNSVENRGERECGSGRSSPIFRNSVDSCNLVQEISFHIVKFSSFLLL